MLDTARRRRSLPDCVMDKAKCPDQVLEPLFEPVRLLDDIPITLEIGTASTVEHENDRRTGAEEACETEKEHPEFGVFSCLCMAISERVLALPEPQAGHSMGHKIFVESLSLLTLRQLQPQKAGCVHGLHSHQGLAP
jgi:hypothetical protein